LNYLGDVHRLAADAPVDPSRDQIVARIAPARFDQLVEGGHEFADSFR